MVATREVIVPRVDPQETFGIHKEIIFAPYVLIIVTGTPEKREAIEALQNVNPLMRKPTFLIADNYHIIDYDGKQNPQFKVIQPGEERLARILQIPTHFGVTKRMMLPQTLPEDGARIWHTLIGYKSRLSLPYSDPDFIRVVLAPLGTTDWPSICSQVGTNNIISGNARTGGYPRDLRTRRFRNFSDHIR